LPCLWCLYIIGNPVLWQPKYESQLKKQAPR
jgi:hypothetical protein